MCVESPESLGALLFLPGEPLFFPLFEFVVPVNLKIPEPADNRVAVWACVEVGNRHEE